MKWYMNLRIRYKLILGFIIVAAIAGAVGILGISNIHKINDADTLLFKQNAMGLEHSGEISSFYQQVRYNSLKITVIDNQNVEEAVTSLKGYCNEVDTAIQNYETTIPSKEASAKLDEIKQGWGTYKGFVEESIELTEAGKVEEARDNITNDAASTGDALRESISELVKMDSIEAKERSESNDMLADNSTRIMVIIIGIGVLTSVALGLWIANVISKPINKLVNVADLLAIGDVNTSATISSKDEIGSLAASFNKMIENIRNQAMVAELIADGDLTVDVTVRSENDLMGKKLLQMVQKNNEVLSNISSAAEQVAVGAKQISDTSITLSHGATEQASSVEELTASLEEISSQTETNAKNANTANELAEDAKKNALQGDNQMQEMLKAMEEISESSANISKIIKVIDDIAFQTNILALNAAVEAARAGQHGKGFAVVAEEVRNLAARSANASKETTDMIESSIKKSESGTKMARDTAQALNQIVNSVDKVANLVNDIAVASNEQAQGIAQINQGIMQVSQVVQTNSATSEESAAASEELSSQAELLKEEVSKFKISKNRRSYDLDEIHPEVMKLLGMNKNSKSASNVLNSKDERSEISKINLNDSDFGKY